MNWVRGTHSLEMTEGGICQEKERHRRSEGHSLSGDGRGTCQDTERERTSEGHLPPEDGRRGELSGLWTRKESD